MKHNKPEKVKEKEKKEKTGGVSSYITAYSYVCISKTTQNKYMLVFTIQFWSTKPRSHKVFSRDSPTYITFALTN